MIHIDYREDRWNKGTFTLDFGWDEKNFEYVMELLRKSAYVLPTYEEECRYQDMIDKLTARKDVQNRVPLEPAEMAELMRCFIEFLCEADAVMGISEQEEGSFSDMVYDEAECAGAVCN